MKGLKKIALVSTIAAISAGAQAELKALDDSAMGELTGQKGLTIDVETKHTIGEFAYHDGGFVVFKDLSVGANTNTNLSNINADGLLDNLRITLDVSDGKGIDGESVLNYANSDGIELAKFMVSRGNFTQSMLDAAGLDNTGTATGAVETVTYLGTTAALGTRKYYADGDLVIHFGFNDAWQFGGGFDAYLGNQGSDGLGTDVEGNLTGLDSNGTQNGSMGFANLSFEGAIQGVTRAVDFNSSIGAIGIAASTSIADLGSIEIGYDNSVQGAGIFDTTTSTTQLISDLSINGYLGTMDIHIENNGNGFSNADGSGDALSQIHWDSFFNVTDLDIYIDIAGVQISDMKINNVRGDLTSLNNETFALQDALDASGNTSIDASGNTVQENSTSYEAGTGDHALGFAHSKRTIYAVNEAVLNPGFGNTGNVANGRLEFYVDGIAINTQFKGDMEIGALSFGDTGQSIGALYWTDIRSTTNLTISAH